MQITPTPSNAASGEAGISAPRQVTLRGVVLRTAICLGLTLCLFAPRLWLMRHYAPGTYQWDRAHTFLLQCESPFRRDIEPAMLWRLLPPLVCHAAGLHGRAALVVPWLGVLAATMYVAWLFQCRSPDWRFALGGTLLFTTTSAVLVPLHWFGVNDGWVWFGLLAVAFGRTAWALPLACLLAPWVDERFIIGLPLAVLISASDRQERPRFSLGLKPVLWLLPYAITRSGLSLNAAVAAPTENFLAGHLRQLSTLIPLAPIGWWMGLRAAWVPIAYTLTREGWLFRTVVAATMAISLWLAADISRSIAILIPVALLGVFQFAREKPALAPRALLLLGIVSLLLPAAHVVYTKIDVISPLPIELFRLFRPA